MIRSRSTRTRGVPAARSRLREMQPGLLAVDSVLLSVDRDDVGSHRAVANLHDGQRARPAKALRPSRAGVEKEGPVALLDGSKMAVPVDDQRVAGSMGTKLSVALVAHYHAHTTQIGARHYGQGQGPTIQIAVPAHRRDRTEPSQFLQHRCRADVAGMHDMIDAGEKPPDLRIKVAVGVRKDPDHDGRPAGASHRRLRLVQVARLLSPQRRSVLGACQVAEPVLSGNVGTA